MARTHFNISSDSETSQLLSERASAGGGITIVTLTSDEVLAAKNWPFMSREVY